MQRYGDADRCEEALDEADAAPERGFPDSSDIAYAWFLYDRRDLYLGKERPRKRCLRKVPEHGF